MAKGPLARPAMVKPETTQGEAKTRLSNVKVNRNRTTSENPKTIRMTPAEKVMCSELVDEIRISRQKLSPTQPCCVQLCTWPGKPDRKKCWR